MLFERAINQSVRHRFHYYASVSCPTVPMLVESYWGYAKSDSVNLLWEGSLGCSPEVGGKAFLEAFLQLIN